MVCGKCGKAFDESAQATEGRCPFCKTVHTPEGDHIRELKGILSYIAQHFGEKTLLDRRRTDALIADIFPKENAARRLCYVALYDGCAQKLWTVRGKPFEVRSAAAARCVKSLRDEIGLKGRSAASAVEAVAEALGCDIAFRMEAPPSAAETESRKNITDSAEQYSLGRHFDRIKDYSRALYWFVQSAQQDCAEAEYYVGFYLMEGRGGTQDVKTAREWFLRAAENGVPAAQYMTGYFYAEGIACELNEGAAFEWFLRSAKQGYEEAIKVIALSYETGTFVDENPETAVRWRKLLPSQPEATEPPPDEEKEPPEPLPDDGEENYQSARRCLAEKDYTGAAMFYRHAAEAGHAKAQCSYGKCLYLGSGVEKNIYAAFSWFSKAAAQGLDIAQYNLGVMYLRGTGVEKNRSEAKRYFRMAAENGHSEAARVLEKLENQEHK